MSLTRLQQHSMLFGICQSFRNLIQLIFNVFFILAQKKILSLLKKRSKVHFAKPSGSDFFKVFSVALRTPAIMLAPLNFQRLILNPLRRKMGKICTSRILPKRNSFRQFQKIQRYLNSFCERLYSLHRAIDKR